MPSPHTDTSLRICIVGGAGRMGRRLARDLAGRGYAIDVLEPDDERERSAVVGAADIVMIAVPMRAAPAVAAEIAPLVHPTALLCDINSLKSEICEIMAAKCRGEVVGLHPMFGPTVHLLRGQTIVVCPVRPGPLAAQLDEDLRALGLRVVEAEPERHDRMMAIVQVLVHFSTIVMGEALRREGVSIEESLRFTSPIYRLELAFVGRLFAQDPDLYAEIELENPHGDEMRAHFLEAAGDVAEVLGRGDRDGFRALFQGVADWFDDFSDEAMRTSDRIIDTMVEPAD